MKDLALILISAGIITLIFKWLKQPLVLGYIVAGLLAGPYIDIFPTVTDAESISTWAEIGVVFLLFALGLEFSFKKLINVGATALITATTEVVTMLAVGYFIGVALGWSTMDSIFLGGMLSMSSTTIIIKAFGDLGLRSQKFTGIVFGTLVVEDLVAILMMVLLSTMAATHTFAGGAMLGGILKVAFFLVLWFLIGIYVLPAFFRKVRKWMNDETLLIIALGLCLGMVVLATATGFSAALGAFIMGSILAETVEGEHIEHIIKPVKDLFGAIFFVSVGMLVDPAVLVEYAWPVLIITLATIVGKAIFSSLGVLISGQTLKTSIQSGFSLAQIGEFAFIIASLGVTLKVMNAAIYPIIVAVSVITTFTTPYFIRLAEPFADWLYKVLPPKTIASLNRYASGARTINHESEWRHLVQSYITRIAIYVVLLAAILLLAQEFSPFFVTQMAWPWGHVCAVVLTLLMMSPFLVALISSKTNSPELFMKLWNDNKYSKSRLIFLVIMRMLIAIVAIGFALRPLFDSGFLLGVIIAVVVVAIIVFFRRDLNRYSQLESRFLINLNEREVAERKKSPLKAEFESQFRNKNMHLATIVVEPESPAVGKTLKELNFRNTYGVTLVKITRGEKLLYIPDGNEYIYPQDKIAVVGTDEQIELFAQRIEAEKNHDAEVGRRANIEISLQSFTIDEHFPYMGLSISDSEIGEKHSCLVIGIERQSGSIMNPLHSTIFEAGDLVWVVGDKKELKKMCK